MRLIDADALERDGWRMSRIVQIDEKTMEAQTKKPTDFPAVESQSEITNEEIRFALKQLKVYFAIKIRDGKDGSVPFDLLQCVEEIQKYFENLSSAQPETCAYWDRESNFCALHRPSAQPERKKGQWIVTSEFEDCRYVKCNQCKVTQVFYYNKPLTNFCPNCGADMRGEL